ncbi:MAG: hypothetical protein J6S85_13470 [Methanobrevibacter sp.]|nr:hypothetical protein [Methanobrevibacter sp.]
MLQINGKTFMNLQEAVQWLLDNNALPFQSSANYAGNTEIGMGTIVNPSPAKVRIGSLIFFADSKVSTVIGLTENGFICSDQYNDLVDDVVYVSNVALNASGHLIVTLSNGNTIDAGLIKQVSSFSINASQHLIVTYNDSTSTDLGAIFSGNITISGSLVADTVEQNNPNWQSTNRNMVLEAGMISAGLTIDNIYNRLTQINGVLYVIGLIAIKNETASDVTVATTNKADISASLPHGIASKIIDYEGNDAGGQAQTDYCLISGTKAFVSTGLTFATIIDSDWDFFIANRRYDDLVQIFFQKNSPLTIPANSKIYLTARIPLILY